MVTLNEYLSHLKTILNVGPASREFQFTDAGLYFILRYLRAELIKNKYNKSSYISDFNYQVLGCLELELHSLDEDCNCEETPEPCKFLRTVNELPRIISGRNSLLIKSVTDLFGNDIPVTEFEKTRYDKYSKTKAAVPQAFIRNNRLYIANNLDLRRINVNAVFFDPVSLADYTSCNGETCYDVLEQYFPMEDDLTSALFQMAYEELIKVSMSLPMDLTNDGKPVQTAQDN